MSGVRRRPSLETDSLWCEIAIRHHSRRSTTFRSCTSPHARGGWASAAPARAVRLDLQRLLRYGERAQLLVERERSIRRDPFRPAAACRRHGRRDSLRGCTSSSIAFWRPSRSTLAVCWNSESVVLARARNVWLFWREGFGRQSRERFTKLTVSRSAAAPGARPRPLLPESRAILLSYREFLLHLGERAIRGRRGRCLRHRVDRANTKTTPASRSPMATPAAKRAIDEMSTSDEV